MVNVRQRNRETYKFTSEGVAKINEDLAKLTKNKPTWHGWLETKAQNKKLVLSAETIKKMLGLTVGDKVQGGEEGVEENKIFTLRELLVAILQDRGNSDLAEKIKTLKRGDDWQLVTFEVQQSEGRSAGANHGNSDKEAKSVSKPVISNQTLPAIPVWHGRENLLKTLQEALQEPMLRILVLMGQGGIGKTSLAVKLLEAIQGDYEQTYFLKVQEGSSFDDLATLVLGDLRVNCKTDDESICAIANLFSKQRCLLVLDELEKILKAGERSAVAEGWGKLLNTFANNQHNSHIILTSRELPADLADQRGYEIDPMLVRVETVLGVNQEASVAILRDRRLKDSKEDLEWVAQRVDGNVFLLSQLASLAIKYQMNLRQHPELVTKNSDRILKEQLARQGEAARDLLRRMCVLREVIDIEGLTFLRLYAEEARFENAMAAGKPVEFTDKELDETEAIIEQLTATCLVQKRYNKKFLYDLHRITIDFLQNAYKDSVTDFMEIAYRFYCTGKAINNPQSIDDLLPIIEAQHFAFQLGKYREAINFVFRDLESYLRLWGHWNQLRDIYDEISPYIENYVNESEKPTCLCKIGISHRDLGNVNDAKNDFQIALEISEKISSELDIAYALECLVDIEDKQGNWDTAKRMIHQSLQIREKYGESNEMASSLLLLADNERKRGNWDIAEEAANRALSQFDKFNNRAGVAMSWEMLGDIDRNRGSLDSSETLYKKALSLFKELGDLFKIARSCSVLGDIERERGNWNEAESLYEQALQLRRQMGARRGVVICIESLGQNELGRGNLKKAEQLLKQSLSEMELLGMAWHIGSANNELAILEKKRGNISAAQEYYKKSNEIFTRLGAIKYLERCKRRWEELN